MTNNIRVTDLFAWEMLFVKSHLVMEFQGSTCLSHWIFSSGVRMYLFHMHQTDTILADLSHIVYSQHHCMYVSFFTNTNCAARGLVCSVGCPRWVSQQSFLGPTSGLCSSILSSPPLNKRRPAIDVSSVIMCILLFIPVIFCTSVGTNYVFCMQSCFQEYQGPL